MTGVNFILASSSESRRAMLSAAGVAFEARPAIVDERAVKAAMLREGADGSAIADALAEMKAVRVSAKFPESLVLGADQILACDGKLYTKAIDGQGARETLEALRGRTHDLVSGAVLARGGVPVWRAVETARLTMRAFSDAFLDHYLAAEGEALLGSVGCYRLEGLGAQLFSKIEGDHFVVRGLPLLKVLEALRTQGVLPA